MRQGSRGGAVSAGIAGGLPSRRREIILGVRGAQGGQIGIGGRQVGKRGFASDGATAEELARSQSLMTGQFPKHLETPGAVASKLAVPLLDAWKKQFLKLPLTCIGKVKAGEGITIRDQAGARPLTLHGYTHFA